MIPTLLLLLVHLPALFVDSFSVILYRNLFPFHPLAVQLPNHLSSSSSALFSRKRRHNRSRQDNENESSWNVLPQLPPSSGRSPMSTTVTSGSRGDDPPLVSRKFQLSYTCKVCDTKNSHMVSRIAYNNGVVIVTCKGCGSQHMIADNLGWSNHPGGFEGAENIEDFLNERGRGDTVSRVDQNVWDLEQLLDKNVEEEIDDTNKNIEGSFE